MASSDAPTIDLSLGQIATLGGETFDAGSLDDPAGAMPARRFAPIALLGRGAWARSGGCAICTSSGSSP